MPSFKHNFRLPNKEFTYVGASTETSLEVRISKPNAQGVITFSVTLPEALVERVRGLHPLYADTHSTKFTGTLSDTSFPDLLAQVADLSQAALTKKTIEEIHGEKMLFVHVRSSEGKKRENLHGGELETLVTIQFGYFVGYLKQTSQYNELWQKTMYFNHIFTAYLQPRGDENAGYQSGMGRKSGELVQVTMENASSSTAFEYYQKRYRFIPYTEEREAFLQSIQVKLGLVTANLNTFFDDLTADRMDLLILQSGTNPLLLGS